MKLHVAGMGYVPVPEKLQRKLLRAAVRTPRVASWLYTVQSGLGLSRAQIEELLERAAELPVGTLRTVLARAGALGIDLLRRMLDDRKRLHVISQLPPSVYLRVHGLAFDTLEKVLHRYGRPRRWVVEQSPDRAVDGRALRNPCGPHGRGHGLCGPVRAAHRSGIGVRH
ncbi:MULTISPECIES: hypothetical protein [Bacteria]|uniref:hypothetical protein n=1 Tax=Pseudomonadati TaxID=3379134 RepID=UPI000223D0E9|nr:MULTISPECIES: hypothetical protein [Bacteria]AEN74739.1 hypothetical protein Rhom172_2860 [Rhodothermus marinus SG0.5JP17-172]